MIVVHHLNESRPQRILWLLEELDMPYEIRHYQRDATTRLAPLALQAVHPLGKSPVVEAGGFTLIESGAIVDFLIRRYGGSGNLRPAEGSALEAGPSRPWVGRRRRRAQSNGHAQRPPKLQRLASAEADCRERQEVAVSVSSPARSKADLQRQVPSQRA